MPHQTNQPPSNMQGYQQHFAHPEVQYPHYNQNQLTHPSLLSYHRHGASYPFYSMNGHQHSMQQHLMQYHGRAETAARQTKEESINQTDEEAAATALLMSAGAPTRMKQDHSDVSPKGDRSNKTEVCQVSPGSKDGTRMVKSPEQAGTHEHDGDSITKEMRQKELATIEDFPSLLHELLSGHGCLPLESISPVMQWMPCGKSWRVKDWQKLANVLSSSSPFPKLCDVDDFLREVEVWGFKKVCEDGGAVTFHHEFFIKIAPNLCKYMKPDKEETNSLLDQIASPPRLGRYGNDLNSVINGKRKETEDVKQGTKFKKMPRVGDDGNTISTPAVPVTPSFTLSTLVSPSSDMRGPQAAFVRHISSEVEGGRHQSPLRLRLQSNRGGRNHRGRIDRSSVLHNSQGYIPVSKRGRRHVNVSSRGGRAAGKRMVLPKKLTIPFTCNGDPSLLRPLSPRPN